MNPFADLVNKVRSRLFASETASPGVAKTFASPVEKPTSERLGKTVMPHATRTIAPQDPFRAASGNSTMPNAMNAGKATPRMISVGGTQSMVRPQDFPPAIALALEPKIERAISLQLSEILDKIPAGYIKSEESFDPTRRILLKAIEIEKGMATRNPSISLSSIYEQVPEIFMRSVPITDDTQLALPFEKVLEQFDRLGVRRDQERGNAVPQVETPFLTVALEESEKFGTTIEPLQASSFPPMRVEMATAEALAAAEPEASGMVQVMPIIPPPLESRVSEVPPHNFAPPPTRIPFHLPPKGTGAPASERVPASSGPPVLPPLIPPRPAPPREAQPLRNPYESIPFDQVKFSSPEPEAMSGPAATPPPRRKRKAIEPIDFELEPIAAPPIEEPKKVDEKIALSLRVLLQNVPTFQRKGEPSLVPEDVRINLPLSLVAEQLATGRVVISPKAFYETIPADYQYLFEVDPHDTPIVLPLDEVMKNVPTTALEMRSDQEQIVSGEAFETPFSIQAQEDAKRFNAARVDAAPQNSPPPTEIPSQPAEKVDAKQVVANATKLPGVDGCSITFSDGLSLAGNFPAAIGADGLCAVAPTLLQRIDKHMLDTKLGPLNSMTLRSANSELTFFMHGNICLSALHSAGELTTDTRTQLAQMVGELSRTYSQPEISHVDH